MVFVFQNRFEMVEDSAAKADSSAAKRRQLKPGTPPVFVTDSTKKNADSSMVVPGTGKIPAAGNEADKPKTEPGASTAKPGAFSVNPTDRIVKATAYKENPQTATFYGALVTTLGINGPRTREAMKILDGIIENGTLVRKNSVVYDVEAKNGKFGYMVGDKFMELQPGDEIVFKSESLAQVDAQLKKIGWK